MRDRIVALAAASEERATAAAAAEQPAANDADAPLGAATPAIPLRVSRNGHATPRVGPLLTANGVSKRFGGVQAVNGIDITVARGETLGLIGPNGAGKTTLFEILSGFTKPDRGTITFDGYDVSRLSPERRAHLGLVRSFQDAGLFSTLTVLETVQLAGERRNPTRTLPALLGARRADRVKEDRARELISLMGLESFVDKQVSDLSTGTRRITELACIIALEPKLVLLDEPSSGVAQRETEALGGLLDRLKQQLDATLIVIEHDMPLIMGISDRIVALDTGSVLAVGTPAEVIADDRVLESYLGGAGIATERSGRRELEIPKAEAAATSTTTRDAASSRPTGADHELRRHRATDHGGHAMNASRTRPGARRSVAILVVALLAAACGTTLPVDEVTSGALGEDPSLAPPGAPPDDPGVAEGAAGPISSGEVGTDGGAATDGAVTGGAGGTAPAGGGPGATVPSGGPAAAPAVGGKPPADHPGVKDDEIAVGISLFTIGNFGDSIGVDISYGNTKAQAQAVVDWINANGGMAGRKVRPVYYTVDFGRAGQVQDGQFEQEACAKWTEDDRVFAAVNTTMARENILVCLANRDVVGVHDAVPVTAASATRYFNHYYSPSAPTLDRRINFQLAALGDRGLLRGRKIGLMYYDDPAYRRIVDQVFVPTAKRLGATEVVLQAAPRGGTAEALVAVTSFQRQGVTDVTFFGEGGGYPLFFMRAAENQLYRPRYLLTSDNQPLLLESGAPPRQLQNVIAHGWYPAIDVGTANDPGPVSPNNQRCLQIQRDAGQNMSDRGAYLTAMSFCSGLFFLKEVLGRARTVSSAGVAEAAATLGGGFPSAGVFSTFVDARRHDAPASYREFTYKCANADCSSGAFAYSGPLTAMK